MLVIEPATTVDGKAIDHTEFELGWPPALEFQPWPPAGSRRLGGGGPGFLRPTVRGETAKGGTPRGLVLHKGGPPA